MMNKYICIALIACACQALSQIAPRKCATHLLEKHGLKNYEKTKKDFESSLERLIQNRKSLKTTDDEIITIPVVVHVMHPNLPLGQKQNVSDQMIQSQIDVINMDFRRLNKDTVNTLSTFKNLAKDAKIQFCLAKIRPDCAPTNGIVRVPNARATYGAFDLTPMKELSHWPPDQYLNIWVTDIEDGYVGYSTFPYQANMAGIEDTPENQNPTYDGVTIDYRCFGVGSQLKPGYRLGRTLTHEIGHWLGLRHLWGDSHCGEDYCNDTPIQDNGTSGCVRKTSCDNINETMMENFMDYTSDDCMNMFSTDQVLRMRTVLQQSDRRKKLVENNRCAKVPLPVYTPDFEGFENGLANPYLILNKHADVSNVGAYESSANSFHMSADSTATLISTKMLFLKGQPNINYFSFDIAVLKNTPTLNDSIIITYTVGCNNRIVPILKIPVAKLSKDFKAMPSFSDWQNFTINLEALKTDYINLAVVYKSANGDKADIYLDNILFSETEGHKLAINFDYSSHTLILDTRHRGYTDIDVAIYSPDGKLIHKQAYPHISSTTIAIDKIANPTSIYLAKVSYDKQIHYYKFAYLEQ